MKDNHNSVKLAIAAAALALTANASAQNIYSGYFTDNYNYRYQMNPAIANEKGFVAIPIWGNTSMALQGDLNLKDVIFRRDGKTVLFTNPNVSTEDAMSGIKDKNKLNVNMHLNLLTIGFKGFGGYNALSVNSRTDVNLQVPGALFSLAKEGVNNSTYDIKNMRFRAQSYVEFALNHSHRLTDDLRVGVTLKYLMGLGRAEAYFNEANLTLGENEWIATTDAEVYASVGGLSYETDVNENTGHRYVSGTDIDSYKPQGKGFGIDLGAEWKHENLTVSAAVLDLGFINWGKTQVASTNGKRTINTSAYIFNPDDDADNSFDNEWERLRDDLEDLYQLSDNGEQSKLRKSLATTINVGVDYALPMYDKLHFGLLSSTRLDGDYTWTQVRLSANLHPVSFFSCNVNGALGTYGTDFGWMANFYMTGFNLFVGMDHTVGKLAKQGVPLESNASFNLGIDFPF